MGEYLGIDSREIHCACNDKNCINGISVEERDGYVYLALHFGEWIGNPKMIHQTEKGVLLTKETRVELIKLLKSIKIKKK